MKYISKFPKIIEMAEEVSGRCLLVSGMVMRPTCRNVKKLKSPCDRVSFMSSSMLAKFKISCLLLRILTAKTLIFVKP